MTSHIDHDRPTHDGRRAPSGPRRRRDTPLLRSLDAEWARTSRRPASLRRARGWPDQIDEPGRATVLGALVDGARDLQQIIDATCRTIPVGNPTALKDSDADEVLAAMITIARHDELAGRLLVQRILPGVITRAKRWGDRRPDEAIDLAIGACWIAISAYDPERRPRHIAAALVSDVIWIAFRQQSRRKSASETPMDTTILGRRAALDSDVHPIIALAETVRAAEAAGVDGAHLDLVRELARAESPSELARRRCVTPRTIRNRRDAARDEIRAALGPDWPNWADRLAAAA